MEWLKSCEHRVDVVVAVKESGGLLQAFVPELVPEDRHANELLTDEERLLDERRAVVSHLVHDREGCVSPRCAGVLGGDGEGVDQGLGVSLADVGENVLDELANVGAGSVDAGNELADEVVVSEGPFGCTSDDELEE